QDRASKPGASAGRDLSALFQPAAAVRIPVPRLLRTQRDARAVSLLARVRDVRLCARAARERAAYAAEGGAAERLGGRQELGGSSVRLGSVGGSSAVVRSEPTSWLQSRQR